MKTVAISFVLTLGLVACSAGNDSPTEPAVATTPAGAQPAPAAVPRGKPLTEALPQGFMLDFPYHFTRRQVVDAGKRGQRLRYTVEFLDGDVDAIAASMAVSAKAAGFESSQTKRLKDGGIHFMATKPGYGELSAALRPIGKRKLKNSAARGTVVMGWPAPATTSAAATTTAATSAASAASEQD